MADPQAQRPFLRVVRGKPTPEELAAVTVVLVARARAAAAAAGQAKGAPGSSNWSARSRLMRQSVSPSPGGWKRSALPR